MKILRFSVRFSVNNGIIGAYKCGGSQRGVVSMMKHTIITIGRQFGSGGHEVGNRLSERLDIPLYDHNLIHMAAQELRISNEDRDKGG